MRLILSSLLVFFSSASFAVGMPCCGDGCRKPCVQRDPGCQVCDERFVYTPEIRDEQLRAQDQELMYSDSYSPTSSTDRAVPDATKTPLDAPASNPFATKTVPTEQEKGKAVTGQEPKEVSPPIGVTPPALPPATNSTAPITSTTPANQGGVQSVAPAASTPLPPPPPPPPRTAPVPPGGNAR